MKKVLLAVLAGMFIAVLPLQVRAEAGSGVVRESNGVWLANRACEGDACIGDLLTCPAGQNLGASLSTITFWQGACDDRDPMRACNGKLTQIAETCTTSEDSTYRGSLIAAKSRGKGRVCFDDTGASDCSDPLPDSAVVVTEIAFQGQSRSVFIVPVEVPFLRWTFWIFLIVGIMLWKIPVSGPFPDIAYNIVSTIIIRLENLLILGCYELS